MQKLRPYQEDCIKSIVQNSKKGVHKQVIVMATGTGKTYVFGQLPPMIKKRGKKTLILAHREELLDQAKEELEGIEPSLKIEIEQAGRQVLDSDTDVVIASVQTIGRTNSKRIEKFNPNEFGLIIIDECHHATADTYKNVLRYFNALKEENKPADKLLLGVTATPNRADHTGLDIIFDDITYNYSLQQGISEGYLSNIKAFTVETKSDISGVGTRMGEFMDAELAEAIDTENRNKLIVETYKELTPDTKALVFATNVEHTINLAEVFESAGIRTGYILGATDKDERKELLKKFKTGEVQVIVNCNVLSEGFNEPSIETILMARPTKSSVNYCLDLATEILTPDGFKKYNQLEIGDDVYGFNLITEKITVVSVEDKIYEKLSNKSCFYSIKTNSVDIRVTSNHRMLYDNKRNNGWKIKKMEDLALLKDSFKIPCAGIETSKGLSLTDAEIQFIGWVMADGSIHKTSKQVFITQGEHQPQLKDLEKCLQECNFKYGKAIRKRKSQFKSNSDCVQFWIGYKQWKYLEKYLSKDFSKMLFEMDERQFDILIEAIHLGDGSKQLGQSWTRRSYHICSGNKVFSNRLQELAVRKGYRCNININQNSYLGNNIYIIHLKKQSYRFIGGQNQVDRESIEKESYSKEKCWCVSNSLGTIITRRNGKVCIMGQSQQVGRGTRIFEEKKHLNLIDFVDNLGNNSIITLPTLFGCKATLKGTKGKFITEIIERIEGIKEVNPDYDVSNINDWNDSESIEKVIKEINIFEQASIPAEVKEYSTYSWLRNAEGFILKLPPKDDKYFSLEIKQNMLDKYEFIQKEYIKVTPIRFNNFKSWVKVAETIEHTEHGLEAIFKKGDKFIKENFQEFLSMLNQGGSWRADAPSDKQLIMLKKFGIAVPANLSKGEACVLIGKAINEKNLK